MRERWLPIPGYEGNYEVSDRGNVRSVDRIRIGTDGIAQKRRGQILRGTIGARDGYRCVNLRTGGGNGRVTPIHRLVLLAFVGPLPPGMVSRHLNGNPTDNRLENLKYGTQSENMHDRVRHGNHFQVNKTHCPREHEYTPENTYRTRKGRFCKKCAVIASREYLIRKKQGKVA